MEKEYLDLFDDPDEQPKAYHTDEVAFYLPTWKQYGREQGMKYMFIVMEGGGGAIQPVYARSRKYVDRLRQLLWISGHVMGEERL